MNIQNKYVRFVNRPNNKPTKDVFKLDSKTIPNLNPGEFLLKNIYLSMDPALVSRMREEKNYVEGVVLGEVMHAYGIAQVIQSRNKHVKVGEVRLGQVNMQQFTTSSDHDSFKKINLGLADAKSYLGMVGITGATAYFAMRDICQPKKGETIIISSGASSVGSAAMQIAKQHGCKTVGIVSTDAKAKRCKQDWGYDAVISYRDKSIEELSRDIKGACPNGIDMYFDNTSGDISEAVMDHYNIGARVAVIGRMGISHLNDTRLDVGRRDHSIMLAQRVKRQGFVILDYQHKLKGAFIQLASWIKSGVMTCKEDIDHGIENTPAAFFRMLDGKNNGKQIVQLAEIDHKLNPDSTILGALLVSRWFPTGYLVKRLT